MMDERNPLEAPPSAFINRFNKIMHRKILQVSQSVGDLRGGLLEIYRSEVLTQKTRTIRLLGVKSSTKIIQTLLGYEVQSMHKRIHCPDLVTARYLKLFSELGCHSIRLPYDPTVTARLVPIMESAVQSSLDTVAGIFPKDLKRRQYAIQKVFAILRNELRDAE